MRQYCSVAALIALSVWTPSAFGQATGLSITNWSLVKETPNQRGISDFEYKADIVNTGPARANVTATLTSTVSSVTVLQGVLHFVNVPANGRATSTDTFTIRVNRTVPFDINTLTWQFSAPSAPVANAGANQTVAVGATATLNGSGSSNPSGAGTLTYSWAFQSKPAGSAAVLQNATTVTPSFIVDVAGTYNITLTVNNGTGTDSATVKVSTSNTPPVANAGPNQSVAVGATVTLNGSLSSDVDGDPLTYAWTLATKPSGSTAVLSSTTAVNPTFTADKAGTYTAQLVVNDSKVGSNTATVTISTVNTAPVANPGANQTVNVGATVQLNGSGSTDVDGDALTYKWSLITVPSGSPAALSSTSAVNPTFVADREGTYVAQLIVNDSKTDSSPKTVTISTNAVQAPTANAGSAQTVKHGALVQLTGSGTDPQSRPLTFQWSLTTRPAGSTAVLSSTTISNPTFTADLPGTFVAQLIVSNGSTSSAPSTVTITTTNSAPVANAGANQTATIGNVVTLNGSASSDADGDALTYSWSFTSRPAGSSAALSAPTSATPTFVPDVAGAYIVQLIVNDGFVSSSPTTVTVTTAAPGQIVIPSSTNLLLAQTAPFNISLSTAAPAGGVTVTLSIGDGSKVTFSTVTVSVAAGATTPASQPQITGIGLGATTVSATAPNYTSATGNVTVGATAAFSPTSANIIGTGTQNLTLTLSAPIPSGLTLNLSSSNTGVATVPATATIGPGSSSTTVVVTGVAPGTATIRASAANVPETTASVTVIPALSITTSSLNTGQVNAAYSQTLAATGGTQPYTWAIDSGTLPAGLSFNNSGALTGTPTAAAAGVTIGFRVTDSGTPAQTVTKSLTLTINAQVPSAIAATGGSGQSALTGAQFASVLTATVTDSGGNPVPGATVTFAVPGSGPSATFAGGASTASATTNGSGVATSPALTANGVVGGPYTVTATVSGVGSPANFSLTNTKRTTSTLTATAGTPQSTTIGTAFALPFTVQALDAGGNPVSGETVTFIGPSSGASGTFAGANTAVTNASGIAVSGIFSANTVTGSYTVTASVPGVTAASFNLTNNPGGAASIAATGGTPQSAQVSTQFGSTLQATVKDSGGNTVSGATVTFTAPGSGASGTFAGGGTTATATTNGSGVATSPAFTANATAGPYTVTATVAGVGTPANFSLTNTAVSGGASLSIGNVTVGNGMQKQITLTLSQPAPFGGLSVNITSANPAIARVAGRPADAGTAQVSFTVGEGLTSVSGIYVHGMTNSGSTTLTASASGWASGTATVTTGNSGFALAGPAGIGQPFSVPVGVNSTVITATAVLLDGSNNVVEPQQVRGGTSAIVSVASTPSSVGTVAASSVTIAGGDGTASTTFQAVATGAATITATPPSGFQTPAGGANSLTATVTGAGLIANSTTVGSNLETTLVVNSNAPPAANTTVTITSSDASKVLFSLTPTGAGQASIGITLEAGRTATPEFYVYGLATSGAINYTVSAPGYANASGTINLRPSGFVILGPAGLGGNFTTTSSSSNTPLEVYAYMLDPGGNPVGAQAVRGGVTATVTVASSNTTTGVITSSPLTFAAGSGVQFTEFDPLASGNTTLSATTATAGFITPASGASMTVTVGTPALGITGQAGGLTIGKGLAIPGVVSLQAFAPAGGVNVTITSNSPALLKLATSLGGTPQDSITINIPAGGLVGQYAIVGVADTGSATYTASASGYSPRTATIGLAKAGFVLDQPFGSGNPYLMLLSFGPQPVRIKAVRLDASNLPVEEQALAGPSNVAVSISNTTTSVGTIAASATVLAGEFNVETNFTPVAAGQTTLSIGTPAGFTTPAADTSLVVKVQ